MKLTGLNIGFGITGSFCTFDKVKTELTMLVEEGTNVIPIFSFNAQQMNTRFGNAKEYVQEIETITGNKAVLTIEDAEPLGPKGKMDIMLIAPCTGNTMAKMCNGITDTPVLMAAKGHVRTGRPLVVSISTNDALGLNLQNIGHIISTKGIYLVPFGQDDYKTKPKSMIAHVEQIIPTLEAAMDGIQIQPVVRSPF